MNVIVKKKVLLSIIALQVYVYNKNAIEQFLNIFF